MSNYLYRVFQTLLLFALLLFLGLKVITNQLTWYINARFVIIAQIGILFLAILVFRLVMELRKSHDDHDHEHDQESVVSPFNLWIMLIPLLIGILIPARPLGASAISSKGFTTSSALISSQAASHQFETESEQRDILDWVTLFDVEDDLKPLMGQQAAVVGFVYHDERLPKGQFFVSRIVVSCCAADGFPVVMIVDWPEAASLKQDTWVRVSGPLDKTYFDKQPQAIPFIRAKTVEIVPQPDYPYLYP
jgi:putative membrane protein